MQKKLEEEKRREILLAAQSRSYEDVCREAEGIMKETGDYEKVSTVYGEAEKVISSPAVKARLAMRREMTDQMLPLFSRMEKLLPVLLEKKPGKTLVLRDGSRVRLKGMKGHLLTVEPQDSREGSGAYQVSWNELPFNSLHALARERRQKQPAEFFFPGGYVFQAFAYFWQADGNHFLRTAGKSIASDGPLFH